MAEKCEFKREGCPYPDKTCVQTRHHLFFPERDYKTKVEQHFRNLPENIEILPRCDHDDVHEYSYPPKKPDLIEMLQALGRLTTNEAI